MLLWLLGYSYSKRFTSLAHFWLGVSLSLAPIAAWIALRGDLEWPPVLLALAVLLWVSGFDIIYACQDVDFDRTVSLQQRAQDVWGSPCSLDRGRLPCLDDRAPGWAWAWSTRSARFTSSGSRRWPLCSSTSMRLVRPDDLTRVNIAFFQVNVVISMGLLVVAVVDLLV